MEQLPPEGAHGPSGYGKPRHGRSRAVLALPIESYRELRAVRWPSSSSLRKHVMATMLAIVTCMGIVVVGRVIADIMTSAIGN